MVFGLIFSLRCSVRAISSPSTSHATRYELHGQEDESRRLFQQTFQAIDSDESKTIDLSEWLAYYCPPVTGGEVAELSEVFALIPKP